MTATAPISARSAIALVVANMIGVGVFTTSGYALADVGSRWLVMLAWSVGAVLAVCGALSYGALALRYPASGGEYEYLRRTLHPTAGVAAGIVSMLAGFGAPLAAAAHLLQVYGCRLLGVAEPAWPLVGTAAIVGAAWLHGHRVRVGARLQDLAVVLKLTLIAAFVIGALLLRDEGSAAPAPAVAAPLTGFFATMPWIYLAYSGWNASAYIAGEVVEPRRNVPRAMWLGCVVVASIYLALNAVILWSVDGRLLAGEPEVAAIAARELFGRSGEVLASAVVVLALVTSILGMTMAGPRVYARMAQDGNLPRWLAPVADAPPRRAIALQALLATTFLWATGLRELMTYIGWTLSLCAAAAVVGLVRVRLREGAALVPCPGWPWVPAVFVAAVAWFAIGSVVTAPLGSLLGLGTLLVAVVSAHALGRTASTID